MQRAGGFEHLLSLEKLTWADGDPDDVVNSGRTVAHWFPCIEVPAFEEKEEDDRIQAQLGVVALVLSPPSFDEVSWREGVQAGLTRLRESRGAGGGEGV